MATDKPPKRLPRRLAKYNTAFHRHEVLDRAFAAQQAFSAIMSPDLMADPILKGLLETVEEAQGKFYEAVSERLNELEQQEGK